MVAGNSIGGIRMIYDINGNPLVISSGGTSKILVASVLDADSDSDRFTAMKQLLDIGKKKLADPDAVISDSEFTYATKGAVCSLPVGNTGMYEKYPFDMLYSKNGTTQAVPASVTKVMSLVTGLDYLENVTDTITIKSSDSQGGSGPSLSDGDTMTMQELMLCMALPSSNTGAQAFARICGAKMLESKGVTTYTDSECRTEFVSKMNAKASYIGMTNSTFDNASGTSSNNLTTANDLIQLLVEACSYPEILKVWNKKTYTIAVGGTNPRSITINTSVANQTLENYYYILGGKTGSISGAKALVMVAKIK